MNTDNCLGVVGKCKDCGNPVLGYLCNDFSKYRKESTAWDYWYSCGNILCQNHQGSGVFQNAPDWMIVK